MDKDQKQNPDSRQSNQSQDKNVKKDSEPKPVKQDQQLTKEDLPDSTNESQGNTGSGQRQDSN
jgi:hypothetical protein